MNNFNRNKSKIERMDGRKIVSKEHQKLIFLKREEYFYNFFKEYQLIKIPTIYSIDGWNIKTYFIEGKEKNIPLAIKDWAKIHNYFIENPLEENKLFMQHDINKVSKYLLQHEDISNTLGKDAEHKLQEVGLNSSIETLIHGDLTPKNFIFYNNDNYYFDFELGGIGHPARDIASLIISNPIKKERIVNHYKDFFNYNYLGLEEDIDNWTFVRALQLYFVFGKRDGDEKQKNRIKDKIVGIIENLV
jgi:thiamine kinase-like enzyme